MGHVFAKMRRLFHPLGRCRFEPRFRRFDRLAAKTGSYLFRRSFGSSSGVELIECPLAPLSLRIPLCRTLHLAVSAARSGRRRLAARRERPRFARFRSAQIVATAVNRSQRKRITTVVKTVDCNHLRDKALVLAPFDLSHRINGFAYLAIRRRQGTIQPVDRARAAGKQVLLPSYGYRLSCQ
jgi:hypothetical protein